MEKLYIHDHHLGKISTVTGKIIDYRNVAPDDIHIEDIANALGNICRFGGHCAPFYSVAQHSVLVSILAPRHLKFAALLHDAAEAYVGDVVKPLKMLIGEQYAEIEAAFMCAIAKRFNIDIRQFAEIKEFDRKALEMESAAFQEGNLHDFCVTFQSFLWDTYKMLEEPVLPPDEAACFFLVEFYRLSELHAHLQQFLR